MLKIEMRKKDGSPIFIEVVRSKEKPQDGLKKNKWEIFCFDFMSFYESTIKEEEINDKVKKSVIDRITYINWERTEKVFAKPPEYWLAKEVEEINFGCKSKIGERKWFMFGDKPCEVEITGIVLTEKMGWEDMPKDVLCIEYYAKEIEKRHTYDIPECFLFPTKQELLNSL